MPPRPGVGEGETTVELVQDVASGRNYFVWQEVKMGWASARSALHQIEDAAGRVAVGKCQLAKTSWGGGIPGGCAKDSDCKRGSATTCRCSWRCKARTGAESA